MTNLDALIDAGFAFSEKSRYYIKEGDQKLFLGIGRKKAEAKLQQLEEEGKLPQAPSKELRPSPEASTSPSEPEVTVTSGPKEGNPLPTVGKSKALSSQEIENLLGEIEDLKPTLAGSLEVTYNGISVFDYHSDEVNRLGVILRWRRKQDKDTGNLVIDDGQGNLTCNGWQVLLKNKHGMLFKKLTIVRDDTPKENFVTNGDLVLCVARKDQYDEKQIRKNIQSYLDSKNEHQKRKKMGQDVSLIKNVDEAASMIKQQNAKDVEKDKQTTNDMAELERLAQQF